MDKGLIIVPIALDEANAFVREHHRHHRPVPGAKFCVAVAASGAIVGVAIVGRPVSRMFGHESLDRVLIRIRSKLSSNGWREE